MLSPGGEFEAWLELQEDQKRIVEYLETSEPARLGLPAHQKCYAECEDGKAFQIVIKRKNLQHTQYDWQAILLINGVEVGDYWFMDGDLTLEMSEMQLPGSRAGAMMFAPMEVDDNVAIRNVAVLGAIEVELTPGNYISNGYQPSRYVSGTPIKRGEEKHTKMALTVVSGPPTMARDSDSWDPNEKGFYFEPKDSKRVKPVSFRWQYNTKEKLEVMGVIKPVKPNNPSPHAPPRKRKRVDSMELAPQHALLDGSIDKEMLDDVKPNGAAIFEAMREQLREKDRKIQQLENRLKLLGEVAVKEVAPIIDLTEDD